MRAVLFGLSTVALVAVAFPAAARITQYECKFAYDMDEWESGWIADSLVLTLDETTGAIAVDDWIIRRFAGKPVAGKLIRQTKTKMSFQWTVRAVDDKGQKSRIEYTLVYTEEDNQTTLSGRPAGYDSIMVGRGDCTVSTQ